MKIVAITKLKNNNLKKLAEKIGSVKKLAQIIGIGYGTLSNVINFKKFPKCFLDINDRRYRKLDEMLLSHLNVSLEDTMPEKFKSFYGKIPSKIERIKIVTESQFLSLTLDNKKEIGMTFPDFNERLDFEKIRKIFFLHCNKLTKNRQKVISLFLEGKNFNEIAKLINRSDGRVFQLFHGSMNRILRGLYTDKALQIKTTKEDFCKTVYSSLGLDTNRINEDYFQSWRYAPTTIKTKP